MDVLTSEICWILNNEIIKQVTSSWSLFIHFLICCNVPGGCKGQWAKHLAVRRWMRTGVGWMYRGTTILRNIKDHVQVDMVWHHWRLDLLSISLTQAYISLSLFSFLTNAVFYSGSAELQNEAENKEPEKQHVVARMNYTCWLNCCWWSMIDSC